MAVKKADVQRVAAKYLRETNRTVGWFIPSNDAKENGTRKTRKGAKAAKNKRGAR